MIGDTVEDGGETYVVVWNGGELLAPRETKSMEYWTPPPRTYNKKSDYWAKDHKKSQKETQP